MIEIKALTKKDRPMIANEIDKSISGKSISIYRDKRLVEARAHITESKVVIQNLERGSYSLLTDNNGIVEFIVE